SACMPLPASGWRATGNPAEPSLVYSDPGFANGPCKTVRMRPTAKGVLLKATCRSKTQPITYSLDEAQQDAVVVRLVSGTAEYCTRFGGASVLIDASGQFLGRQ